MTMRRTSQRKRAPRDAIRTGGGARSSAPRFVVREVVLPVALCLVVALAAGCVTEYEPGQEPLAPRPRPVPAQPSGATADVVQIFPVLYAKDTNADGWGDVIQVMMYLWSSRSEYNYPVHDDRPITFAIYRPGEVADPTAEPVALWAFTAEQMNESRTRTVVGNAYYLELPVPASVYQPGRSPEPPEIADLVAVLASEYPDNPMSEPIRSGVSTIRLRSGAR